MPLAGEVGLKSRAHAAAGQTDRARRPILADAGAALMIAGVAACSVPARRGAAPMYRAISTLSGRLMASAPLSRRGSDDRVDRRPFRARDGSGHANRRAQRRGDDGGAFRDDRGARAFDPRLGFSRQGRRDGGRGQGGRGSAIRLKPWPASWSARRGQGHHRHRRHADRVRRAASCRAAPAADATIVARLRAAGAIVMGKVVTAEYALFVPGPTRNPHDLSRSPGGSSMGSAAAVAAHMAPVALATQTKGSIIRPASFCGVVGYKPSLGLLPRTGILRQSTLLDQPGVMARDVADAAFVVDAISGRDDADELSLEEVPSAPLSHRGRTVAAATGAGSRALLGASRRNEPARKSNPLRRGCRRRSRRSSSRPSSRPRSRRLTSCCARASPSPSRPTSKGGEAKCAESVIRIIERGLALTAVDVRSTRWFERDRLRQLFHEIVAPYDALLTPAAIGAAPPAEEGTGDPIFAATWTLVGAPAVSLPLLAGEAGLPLGLQAVGAPRQRRRPSSRGRMADARSAAPPRRG